MLLDSNLIIYASQPNHAALRSFIAREVPCVSAVSKVETLGYRELTDGEKQFLEEFFRAAEVVGGSSRSLPRPFKFVNSALCHLEMHSLPGRR